MTPSSYMPLAITSNMSEKDILALGEELGLGCIRWRKLTNELRSQIEQAAALAAQR